MSSLIETEIMEGTRKVEEARAAYTEALKVFKLVAAPFELRKTQIIDAFRAIKNAEIERDHSCECCRPRTYDDGWFVDAGIHLRIDADHPNDIWDHTFPWEIVEQTLNEQEGGGGGGGEG